MLGTPAVPTREAQRIIRALVSISLGGNPCEGPSPLDKTTAKELADCFASVSLENR